MSESLLSEREKKLTWCYCVSYIIIYFNNVSTHTNILIKRIIIASEIIIYAAL